MSNKGPTAGIRQLGRVEYLWQLELALTADRIWATLVRRPAGQPALISESWGMLRPSGDVDEKYIRMAFWDASLELMSRHVGE